MSRSILAIIELDNYPAIVTQRAAWLAKLCEADLTLLLCESSAGFLTDSLLLAAEAIEVAEQLKMSEQQTLEELRDSVAASGVDVNIECSDTSSKIDSIIAHADRLDPLYVIKGTHYHRPSERASFSDIDWQLIRKLRAPLWFAKPKSYEPGSSVIAAIDPTSGDDESASLDQEIIKHAKRLSEQTGGTLSVIHTYQRIQEIGALAMRSINPVRLPIDELDARIKREHSDRLHAFTKKHDIVAEAVHQLPGRAWEIIPTFTRANAAGLLIMGGVARSSLKQRLVGNTAQRTLDHVECDVLVVHTDAHEQKGQAAA